MQILGKLIRKLDEESGVSKAGKEWKKQGVLIEQDGEYNKEVVVSFFGDKMDCLRNVSEGDTVKISINLSSREYNGKYFHNIDGWFCSNVTNETVGSGHQFQGDMADHLTDPDSNPF